MSVSASTIDIYPSLNQSEDYIICAGSSVDFFYSINKYHHGGSQNIKIQASFTYNGVQKKTNHCIEAYLPKPWEIEKFSLKHKSLNFDCLRITTPNFILNTDLKSIEILDFFHSDSLEQQKESKFVINNNNIM